MSRQLRWPVSPDYGRMSLCIPGPMESLNPRFLSTMSPRQRSSMRKFLAFAWSATSASAAVRCKLANIRSCCCLRRVVRSASLHRTTEVANCTSLSQFQPPSWRHGKYGLRRMKSLSKRAYLGSRRPEHLLSGSGPPFAGNCLARRLVDLLTWSVQENTDRDLAIHRAGLRWGPPCSPATLGPPWRRMPQPRTLAECVSADACLLAYKPRKLSMREAAVLPLSTITAREGLVDRAQVRGSQKVLVYAGAGGVGHIVVQIARAFGAECICNGFALQEAPCRTIWSHSCRLSLRLRVCSNLHGRAGI